ncbi:conserved Plasmodium protein, unknown function [Plasmodium knowlesi strain H]|uniref:Uncharacterized protein n=3 Tax=Plasmodium knowlesi TaxID=5850 RepID=A0A5K1UNT8_PLAKH|nr:conserved Plasmodium protein, unknown function [Plasmodium knowlesi strain H]OTN66768.1 putative Ser/Thr kinase [Plasmodium knowlesi]CAA9986705.1 conserved Plasmodium protein, unknown function [Plasmodium knowlesi strain H]SBO23518.1 conserved Plasmodium protein, unknown function [Plasmodium knowlesi strain H]SBO25017.1 conserved Plasmodium protein, unknown function [Plasmodium knowlesi strain H]VVS76179.1 conserved Plasmodium protein, unknown function [Plasmodium knowlesi strain H]|eukprot:XP_002257890.1 Ser/Thr kinase, putative [Plasmodium knowlesi strain H]
MKKTEEGENNPKKGKREEEEKKDEGSHDVTKNRKEEKSDAIINYDQREEHLKMPPYNNHQGEGESESTRNNPQLEASLSEERLSRYRSVHGVDEAYRQTHKVNSNYNKGEEEKIEVLPKEPHHVVDMNCDDVHSIVDYLISVDREKFNEKCAAQGSSDDDKYDDTRDGSYDEAHGSAQGDDGRTPFPEDTPAVADPQNVSLKNSQMNHMDKYDIKYRHILNSMVDYIFSHPDVNFLELMNKRERDEGGNRIGGRRRPIKWYNHWTRDDPFHPDDFVAKRMRKTKYISTSDNVSSYGCELSWQKGQPSDIAAKNFRREIVSRIGTSHYVSTCSRYNSHPKEHSIVEDQTEKAKSVKTSNKQMNNTHRVDNIRARIETLHKGIFSSLNKLRGNHRECTAGEDPQEENRKGENILTFPNRTDRNFVSTDFNLVGNLPLYIAPTDWKNREVYVHAPCERKKSVIRSMNRIMGALLPEGRKTILSCVSIHEDMYVWINVRFVDFSFSHGNFTQLGAYGLDPLPSGPTSNYYSSRLYTGKKNSRWKMNKVDNDKVDMINQMEKVQFFFHIREFTRQQYKMNMLGEYLQVKEITESNRHLGGDFSGRVSYNNAHFNRREVHIKRFELLYQYYVQFLRRFYLESDASMEEATLIRMKGHMYGSDRCANDCVGQQQGGDPSSLEISHVETTEVVSSRAESSHRGSSQCYRSANLAKEMADSLPGCPPSYARDNADQEVNPKVNLKVCPHPKVSVTDSASANAPMSAKEISQASQLRLLHRCAKKIGRFLRRSRMHELEKRPLRKMRKIVKSLCGVCAIRYRSFLSQELLRLVLKSAGSGKSVKRERRLDQTEREELPHQANLPCPAPERRPVKIILKKNIKFCKDPLLQKHFKLDDSPERNVQNEEMVKHTVENVTREDSPNGPVVDHTMESTTTPPSEVPPHPDILIEGLKKSNMIKKKTVQVQTEKTREKCSTDVKRSDRGKKKRTLPGKIENDHDVTKKKKRTEYPPGEYLPESDIKIEEDDKQRKVIKNCTFRSKYFPEITSGKEEQPKSSRFDCKTHRKESKGRCIYYVYLKGQLGVYLSPQMKVIYEKRNLFFKVDDKEGQRLDMHFDMHFDEVFSRIFFRKILPTCVEEMCVRKVSTGSPQRRGDSDGRGRSGSIHSSRSRCRSRSSSSSSSSYGCCKGQRFSGETNTKKRKNMMERATSKVQKLKRDQVVTLFQILYEPFYKCFSRLNVCSLLGTYCSDSSVCNEGDPHREVDKKDEAEESGEPREAQNEYYYHTFLSRFFPLGEKKTVVCAPQDFFKCLNKNFIRTVIYHVNKTLGDFSFIQKLFDEYELMERVCAGKMAKTFLDCSDYEVTFREEDRYYNVIKEHFVNVIVPFCEENSS